MAYRRCLFCEEMRLHGSSIQSARGLMPCFGPDGHVMSVNSKARHIHVQKLQVKFMYDSFPW